MTRYNKGVITMDHRGKKVTTSVGTRFDRMVEEADDEVYQRARLKSIHEARPDSMSDIFFDSPDYWWFFQHINNISDPIQQMTNDKRINIPDV